MTPQDRDLWLMFGVGFAIFLGMALAMAWLGGAF